MIEDATMNLTTAVMLVVGAVTWAGGLAGVYYTLKGRMDAQDVRLNNHAERLQNGETKFNRFDEHTRDVSDRLARIETMMQAVSERMLSVIERNEK